VRTASRAGDNIEIAQIVATGRHFPRRR
jgi:hypothetical protein